MNQELLLPWRLRSIFLSPLSLPSTTGTSHRLLPHPIRATLHPQSASTSILTPKEKRQLRNERREQNSHNWREEVEQKLMKKPKKMYKSRMEQLNLDKLVELGPQWWVLRVPTIKGQETAERMAKALVRNFPDLEFKLYAPTIQVKRKLKNGSVSVKPKALFPGCVFLNCIMNKEVHDLIRECEGVRGFIGSKVGNTKRQINKPIPVSSDDMEEIFKEAKEKQQKSDKAFEEEHGGGGALESEISDKKSVSTSSHKTGIAKTKRKSRKASEPLDDDLSETELYKLLPGSTVRVLSGAFAEFTGTVMKLDNKRRLATVGFSLFGKGTLADIDFSEIVAEPN